MRTIVSPSATIAVSSLVSLVVLSAACTQAVESEGTTSEANVGLPPISLPPPLCTQPRQGPEDGVLVRLTPRSRRGLWECPVVAGVQGSYSAEYIAWREGWPLECTCGLTDDKLLAVQFGAEWSDPNIRDSSLPYCLWLIPDGLTQAALELAVRSEVPDLVSEWTLFDPSGGTTQCAYPGGHPCPTCTAPKAP